MGCYVVWVLLLGQTEWKQSSVHPVQGADGVMETFARNMAKGNAKKLWATKRYQQVTVEHFAGHCPDVGVLVWDSNKEKQA